MAVNGEGLVETTQLANDGKRVFWVGPDGFLSDLLPTGRPPLITGIAADGQRLIVIGKGETFGQDIQPNKVGLTAQSVAALTTIFKGA